MLINAQNSKKKKFVISLASLASLSKFAAFRLLLPAFLKQAEASGEASEAT